MNKDEWKLQLSETSIPNLKTIVSGFPFIRIQQMLMLEMMTHKSFFLVLAWTHMQQPSPEVTVSPAASSEKSTKTARGSRSFTAAGEQKKKRKEKED